MRIKDLLDKEPKDHKSFYSVDYWYDRSQRLWTILRKDKEDNQIGNAEYAPDKTTRDKIIALIYDEDDYKGPKKG